MWAERELKHRQMERPQMVPSIPPPAAAQYNWVVVHTDGLLMT